MDRLPRWLHRHRFRPEGGRADPRPAGSYWYRRSAETIETKVVPR